jgi:mono/diheme cytochrome c family protein
MRVTAIASLVALAVLGGCGERAAESGSAPAASLAAGAEIYARHCAACHGANLEGQPNWRERRPDGRLPAPPHDASGHTWHHSDEVLFNITKFGMVPPYAPRDYPSDMPAFKDKLTDEEIRAVLAYIESRWSDEVRWVRAEMLRQAGR